MAASRTLPTIITFSIIALVLAGIAVLLPHSENEKAVRDFQIEYDGKNSPTTSFGEESVFDFLKFELSPVEITPLEKIVRSRQPINQKNVAVLEEDPAVSFVQSPTESLLIAENNTEEAVAKVQKLLETEAKIHTIAIESGDLTDCDAIESPIALRNCRDEINFRTAITKKDVAICEKIEGWDLKKRCENYVQLIPEDESAE